MVLILVFLSRPWSTMEVFMLMCFLLILVFHQIPMTLSINHLQPLGTHIVRYFCLLHICIAYKVARKLNWMRNDLWCVRYLDVAVVTYLPKSKANKKKSLLGNSKDSDVAETQAKAIFSGSWISLISVSFIYHDKFG